MPIQLFFLFGGGVVIAIIIYWLMVWGSNKMAELIHKSYFDHDLEASSRNEMDLDRDMKL